MQKPVRRLGGSSKCKNSLTNAYLEQNLHSRDRSKSNYENRFNLGNIDPINDKQGKYTVHTEAKYKGPNRYVNQNDQKLIQDISKSPLKTAQKIILKTELKLNEVISEREMNLMRKVSHLQKKIVQLRQENYELATNLNAQIQKLKAQNQMMKRLSTQTERRGESIENLSTPIKEIKGIQNEENQQKIYTLKKLGSNDETLKKVQFTNEEGFKEQLHIQNQRSKTSSRVQFGETNENHQKLQSQIKELSHLNSGLNQQLNELRQALVGKQRIIQELVFQNGHLKSQIIQLKTTINENKNELTSEQRQNQIILEQSLQNIAAKIQKLTTQNDKLQFQNQQISKQVQMLKEQNYKLTTSMQEYQKQMEEELLNCQNKIAQLEKKEGKSCQRCKELVDAVFKLNNKIESH